MAGALAPVAEGMFDGRWRQVWYASIANATELGGCRCRGRDGSRAGSANVLKLELFRQFDDCERIDDAACDSTLHHEITESLWRLNRL